MTDYSPGDVSRMVIYGIDIITGERTAYVSDGDGGLAIVSENKPEPKVEWQKEGF